MTETGDLGDSDSLDSSSDTGMDSLGTSGCMDFLDRTGDSGHSILYTEKQQILLFNMFNIINAFVILQTSAHI